MIVNFNATKVKSVIFKKICLYEYDNQMKLITILKNWKKNPPTKYPYIFISAWEKKKTTYPGQTIIVKTLPNSQRLKRN